MELFSIFSQHARPVDAEVDVCLIAEGCYPYVAGGVSSWIDWLIRSQPETTFSVLAILPTVPTTAPRYPRPSNLRAVHHLLLDDTKIGRQKGWPSMTPKWYAAQVQAIIERGDSEAFARLLEKLGPAHCRPSLSALLNSEQAWEALGQGYSRMPQTSFISYFWAWRTLVGGMLRALAFPLPNARLYHAVSTGYAGLVAARAAIDTGRPMLITEHGIYSNERRVEILMADWIKNSIDNGLDFSDERNDIRDLWADAFEGYARISYASAREIIALYSENSSFQRALGADPDKLSVIPNGIDIERFTNLPPRKSSRPTLAFLGRVTPIKDVQTFIDVAELTAANVPGLRALVIGPMDEDPEYAQGCIDAVRSRGLQDVVTFTGAVDVREYMGEIDVLMLTSISEALPLVLLEAGAASVCCIATDVGACREILGVDGAPTRSVRMGDAGFVAPLGDVVGLAAAATTALTQPELRQRLAENLRGRVRAQYRSEAVAGSYGRLYRQYIDATLIGGN